MCRQAMKIGTPAGRLGASLALCVGLLLVGCTPAPRSVVRPVDTPAWDAEGLREMQPCLLALGPDENGTDCLQAFSWDGQRRLRLWNASTDESALLLDADARSGRVLLAVTPRSPGSPGEVADTVVALEPDGRVATVDEPDLFPLVADAVLVDDSILLLRRRESDEAVETTLVVVSDGTTDRVTARGLPPHQDIVGIGKLQGGSVALLLKLAGSPAPRDDFAVLAARLEGPMLTALSEPFLDDSLFSVAPGPEPDTAVYVKSAEPEGSAIVSLVFAGRRVQESMLVAESDVDPGFDYSCVLGAGPDGSVLFRSLGTTSAPARLRMIAAGSHATSETPHTFPPLGDDWLWLDAAGD